MNIILLNLYYYLTLIQLLKIVFVNYMWVIILILCQNLVVNTEIFLDYFSKGLLMLSWFWELSTPQ